MTNYKLVYFNAKGRAELIRWLFAVGGQAYEDIRFEREDWPNYKPNAPFGQAPFLEIHDGANITRLPQSTAIARFLARKFNLAGKNEEESAQVDAFVDQINDLINELAKVYRESDPVRKVELEKKIANEVWPANLKIFEEFLTKNKGWLVGNEMTWADMFLTVVLDWLKDKSILDHYPKSKELTEKVVANPKIAEWIKKRPKTEN